MKFLRKLLIPLSIILISLLIVVYNFRGDIKNDISSSPPTPIAVLTPIPTPTPIPAMSSFSFAVISDIHSDLPSLEKTLDRIKKDKMDFIIVAGDLTSLGKINELQNVKAELDNNGMVYYVIPGNHDLWSVRNGNNPYKEVFGKDYQSFLKGKVKFILINNGDGVVGIDKTQQVWLNNEITDCPRIYCLVFAHMPLNNSLTTHFMGEDNAEVASQAALLVKKFNDYQIKELFAGHIHYLSNYTLDGLQTNTAGAIFTDNNSSAARFLEVKVDLPEVKLTKKEIWL